MGEDSESGSSSSIQDSPQRIMATRTSSCGTSSMRSTLRPRTS